MARVALEGVSKVFAGGVVAVDSLDLEVQHGELVVLVGPSGSGKTTILRIIAGLDQPTEGTIRIGERLVNGLPPRERDVAYVPQSCPLYPHLKVYDNIALSGRMRYAATFLTRLWRRNVQSRGLPNSRVRETADRLGIGHLLERWPRQLSGGERQRVALARAIVREPAAFLFDEPLSSLDASLRSQLQLELRALQSHLRQTTLYVTHDQDEALLLADRLAVLNKGKLEQVGTPDGVYDRPATAFVARFVCGQSHLNLLPGKVQQRELDWFFVGENWQFRLEAPLAQRLSRFAEGVQLGLRAEACRLVDAEHPDARRGVVAGESRRGDVRWLRIASSEEENHYVVAKLPSEAMPLPKVVYWLPDWRRVHWFDHSTGKRIEID